MILPFKKPCDSERCLAGWQLLISLQHLYKASVIPAAYLDNSLSLIMVCKKCEKVS